MYRDYIKYIITFAIGVLVTSIAFLLYNNHTLKQQIIEVEKPVIKYHTEVITKVDTIYKEIIKPKYIKEQVIRIDTLRADMTLPITQREYLTNLSTDSVNGEIRTVVSGYNAALDTLQYRLDIPMRTINNTIEIERVKYKRKHFNFTVGVGAGYGLTSKRTDLFIGGVVGYSF